MKALVIGCCLIAAVVAIGASPAPSLESYTSNLTALVRITKEPQKMESVTAFLCAPPPVPDPHGDKYIDVYISKQGLAVLQTGKGVYPLGTVLLKAKYPDKSAKRTELFTGMIKREQGFNPQGGDWEYFVVSGDGKKVTEQEALPSCMGCHSSYSQTDYVTRNYPPLKSD